MIPQAKELAGPDAKPDIDRHLAGESDVEAAVQDSGDGAASTAADGAPSSTGGAAAESTQNVPEHEAEIKALEGLLAQHKKDEQTLQQKTWKANKQERKLLDAKILSLQARIKGITKKVDRARAVADAGQTCTFEKRLAARERGELGHETPCGAVDDSTARIHLRGAALVFLEVDGVVSTCGGGVLDELLRVLREMVCVCVCVVLVPMLYAMLMCVHTGARNGCRGCCHVRVAT
jgi:hypothetical protein